MKILFDHCVPKPFARALPSHEIKTTSQMRWTTLSNGRLLSAATGMFDVFLTVDKNMKSQQNLKSLPLPIIVLDVDRNTPDALLPFAAFVEIALLRIKTGEMIEIDSSGEMKLIS